MVETCYVSAVYLWCVYVEERKFPKTKRRSRVLQIVLKPAPLKEGTMHDNGKHRLKPFLEQRRTMGNIDQKHH